ncbi:fibropellin-3-like [Saccostrea echinata]|uniref:fibropellin-3-like n=1 Tax=Saccostrea echinata TaxID=191078 RepID=UPI002A8275F8|nr:fibropellin-3-like [Saccostrea echinata]
MNWSLLSIVLLVSGVILHWRDTLAQDDPILFGSCTEDSGCPENALCNTTSSKCYCAGDSVYVESESEEALVCQRGACSLRLRSDECAPNGICRHPMDVFDIPICFCDEGFFGTRCNDFCARSSDCNGGICVEEEGKKVCECPPGAEGNQCQITTSTSTTTATTTTTMRNRLGGLVLAVGGGIGLLAILGAAAASSSG